MFALRKTRQMKERAALKSLRRQNEALKNELKYERNDRKMLAAMVDHFYEKKKILREEMGRMEKRMKEAECSKKNALREQKRKFDSILAEKDRKILKLEKENEELIEEKTTLSNALVIEKRKCVKTAEWSEENRIRSSSFQNQLVAAKEEIKNKIDLIQDLHKGCAHWFKKCRMMEIEAKKEKKDREKETENWKLEMSRMTVKLANETRKKEVMEIQARFHRDYSSYVEEQNEKLKEKLRRFEQ